MKPARLFDDDDLGYLSPGEKELVAFFEKGQEGDLLNQNSKGDAETEMDELSIKDLEVTIGSGEGKREASTEDEGKVSDVEDGDESAGFESLDSSSRRKSERLKGIQERAAEARKKHQQSQEDKNSLGRKCPAYESGSSDSKVGI